AKQTDELFKLAYEIAEHPSRRELDMLLTAGERISMSLLSLALLEEGLPSISFTGSQSGIITDKKHGNARILNVRAFRIKEELATGKVVIVAGFQGVSLEKEITTLGRGGSDTTAVALASYLQADKCEIFTDVDGVYTADPRIVPNARKLKKVPYQIMLALANDGSKVLHPRSVEFACAYKIPVELKSSFTFEEGTYITEDMNMEERGITAIAHKENLTRSHIRFRDQKQLIDFLNHLSFDIFNYQVLNDQEMYINLEEKYQGDFQKLLTEANVEILDVESKLGSVSVVGVGINYDLEFVAEVIQAMEDIHAEIRQIQRNDLGLIILIPTDKVREAVNVLHERLMSENLFL
ncbi:MAG TPA: aspartate kinase, partial [Candidatus Cloacimonadota bacterium]|nr:aspartate kinase [Candidatus Cloacimonadota bacterium]